MDKIKSLNNLYKKTNNCQNCKLSATRINYVFGTGNPHAEIMFIGEAPGKQEDLKGKPFVGRAGELLTAVIEKGMHLSREDVYICNIIKCRPTINQEGLRDRPPLKEEINACSWILLKQIEIINPKVIITLGNPATKFILNTKSGITKLRGIFSSYNNISVMPTYHPSYIIRNGGMKSKLNKIVYNDMKMVLKFLKSVET